jgi:hypothetical protein
LTPQGNSIFKTPTKKALGTDAAKPSQGKLVEVFSMNVVDCHRDLSDHTLPNDQRGQFGAGTILFYEHTCTGRSAVRFFNMDGERKVEAAVPLPKHAHDEVQGNNGAEYVFFWEATNLVHAAGRTTIKGAKDPSKAAGLRRIIFIFAS